MATDINAMPACEAAVWYQEHGLYIHPLTGKKPILKAWQARTEHLSEQEITEHFETKKRNVGLICGEISNCTVIDRDHMVSGIWHGLELSPVRQARTASRDHLFYRYCAELPAKKYHALGFEILNIGNNCVLTPSIHPDTGEKYQLTESPENRPVMQPELIEHIQSTVNTWNALQATVSKCRHVYQAFFKSYFTDNDKKNTNFRDMSIFHGATGRELTLYLFSELKAAGATNGELHLLCMLMFLDSYNSKDSEYQIGKIKATATAKTATIQAHPILSQFYDSERDYQPTPANTKKHQPTPATESLTPEETIRLVESAKRQMVKYKNQTESARQLVCKQVWKNHSLDGRMFTKAYNEVFSHTHEAESEENEDPLSIYPAHIIKQARDILLNGDPKTYILDTWNKSHIGDRKIGDLYTCSYASTFILNSDGEHIKPGGDSGKGKSSSGQKFGRLIPEDRFFFGSMSGKAALYHNLKPGTVICLDDTDYGDDLISLIKQSTTEFQRGTKHKTVKDQAALEVSIPARCVWWLNSVDGLDDEQLTNRFISADVDSSAEQDERVFQQQIDDELTFTTGDSDDVLVCRCMYSMLGLELYDIRIPFLQGRFTWQNKNNRRNFKMFKDIIRSVTLYKIYQREKVGNCYLSTVEDFDEAVKIYQSIAEANYTKLNNTQKKAMECMVEQKRGVDRKTLMKRTGISQTGVKQLMHGKNGNGGLLSFVAGLSDGYDSERRCVVYDYNGDKFGLVSYDRIAVLNRDNIEATINEFKTKTLSAGANTSNTQETPRKHPLGVSTKTVSSEYSKIQVTPTHSKLQECIYQNTSTPEQQQLTINETLKNENNTYTNLTFGVSGVTCNTTPATDTENQPTPAGVSKVLAGVTCNYAPSADTETVPTPEAAGTVCETTEAPDAETVPTPEAGGTGDNSILDIFEACSQWEAHNHTSITSVNHIPAAMDIAKRLKLPDIEPVQALIKQYAKLATPATPATPTHSRIINIKKTKWSCENELPVDHVYIGRENHSLKKKDKDTEKKTYYNLKKSIWHNPFIAGKHGTLPEILTMHLTYVLGNDCLLEKVHTLHDNYHVCWCYPEPCHAQNLLKLADITHRANQAAGRELKAAEIRELPEIKELTPGQEVIM